MQVSSANVTAISGHEDDYANRARKRMLGDFPSEEEFNLRIAACEADIASYQDEIASIMAEIAGEQGKLSALAEKAKAAESAFATQRNIIRLLQNKVDTKRRLVAGAAKDKAEYEAQLANKDHLKFKNMAG